MLCGLSRETPGEAGKYWGTCRQSHRAEPSNPSEIAAQRGDWATKAGATAPRDCTLERCRGRTLARPAVRGTSDPGPVCSWGPSLLGCPAIMGRRWVWGSRVRCSSSQRCHISPCHELLEVSSLPRDGGRLEPVAGSSSPGLGSGW